MATLPVTLLNGTVADATQVMQNFTEIYTNIDQTNVQSGNKTGTGRFVLDTSPTISDPILSGTVTGTYNLAGTPTITAATLSGTFLGTPTYSGLSTFSSGITLPTTQRVNLNVGGTSYINEVSASNLQIVAGAAVTTFNATQLAVGAARDVILESTKRLCLDNTFDTYVSSPSANRLNINCGGGLIAQFNNVVGLSIQSTSDFSVSPTRKVYYDGGGNTFHDEVSANVLRTVVGGTDIFRLTSSKVGILNSDPSLHTSTFDDVIIGDVTDAATGMALCCDPATGQSAIRFKTVTGSASSNLLVYDAATNSVSLKSPTINLGATAVQATINSSGELTLVDRSAPTAIGASSQRSFAKAWGRVNSLGTLVKGYNCSSSRTSPGNFTITLTTAMSDANYVVVASLSGGGVYGETIYPLAVSTTSITFALWTNAGAALDAQFNFAVYGT